jgi:hypothetical protein
MMTAIAVPLVQATLAIYMFKIGNEEHRLLEASVGAGLMAVWTSVLSGSGGAIQSQRWRGTLEILMISPCSPTFTILPITLATSIIGACSMAATLLWGRLLFGIPFSFAHPVAFMVGVPAVILALGMFGFLLASTFVLLRNANVLHGVSDLAVVGDAHPHHGPAGVDAAGKCGPADNLGCSRNQRDNYGRACVASTVDLLRRERCLPSGRVDRTSMR